MFRQRIREHAAHVGDMLNNHRDILATEAQTKASLIGPFLRCLGYDSSNHEQVKVEVSTTIGGKIDYQLTGQRGAKIAVEAKKVGVNLSEKETNQLRSYFTFSEAVAGILTNGVDCWLFTDAQKTNVMDSAPYLKIDIRTLTNNDITHLDALARGNVHQGAIHEQAKRERYRTQINEIVAEELRSPSLGFLKLVGKRVGIKPLTKANLEFLGPLVTEATSGHLSEETSPDLQPEAFTTTESPPTPSPEDLPASVKAVITKEQFRGATLFGQKLSVQNYRQVLTSVVAELQTRHGNDFATRVRDENVFRGKKWWYVSTEQHHLSPKQNKHKVGNYWIDTNLDAKGKVRRARWFLKAFGHDSDELEIHTSDD